MRSQMSISGPATPKVFRNIHLGDMTGDLGQEFLRAGDHGCGADATAREARET